MLTNRNSQGLSRVIVISAGVHVAFFCTTITLASFQSKPKKAAEQILITKLVRLGKERPAHYLPRKVAAAPAKTAPVAIKPKTSSATSTPQEKLPSAQERIKQLSQTARALERLKSQTGEEPEGRADGVSNGEVTDALNAVAGNMYATEIVRCLQQNYDIMGINSESIKNRSVGVFLRIERDGTFIDHRIERSSGLKAFDRAVERAIKLCGKVSAPPKPLRERVRNDGIEVEFKL
ncbi:MAG: cell envelope integrity protein TolA [Deltaproteobacteria bacterium]|nr:cell envelope integrity protein TolA [Deltaproteobacteria bacterium]